MTVRFTLFLVLFGSTLAYGASKHHYLSQKNFPIADVVRSQLKFWEKIFVKYPTYSIVIHDDQFPELIIDVIDFESLKKQKGKAINSRRSRLKFTDRYVASYQKAVRDYRRYGKAARKKSAIHRRLFDVYRQRWANLTRLYRGDVKFRSQTGLSDEFKNALERSKMYMKQMEEIFISYNLPRDLTRMVFVESMFNLKARSKVGASGIWQFMPATARRFLYVNRYIDERNSPLKATKAAAKLLSANYQDTGSWPIAITAYNHGLAGMKRAVRQIGTKDFSQIVRYYRSPSFGFASRNFYAEFLAAANTYRMYQKDSKVSGYQQAPFRLVSLNKPVSVYQLVRYTPISKSKLYELNPCLLTKAKKNIYRLLPKSFEVVVPSKQYDSIVRAVERIKPSRRLARR